MGLGNEGNHKLVANQYYMVEGKFGAYMSLVYSETDTGDSPGCTPSIV